MISGNAYGKIDHHLILLNPVCFSQAEDVTCTQSWKIAIKISNLQETWLMFVVNHSLWLPDAFSWTGKEQ